MPYTPGGPYVRPFPVPRIYRPLRSAGPSHSVTSVRAGREVNKNWTAAAAAAATDAAIYGRD